MRRINEVLKERARSMRREPTKAERLIWNRLRGNREDGLRFRRQHEVSPYIADFACTEAKLIIEIDGEDHHWRFEEDFTRTAFLESKGYRIVRYSNFEVMSNPRSVVIGILMIAYSRVPRLADRMDEIPSF